MKQENEEQELQHTLHQGNEEEKGMETVNLVELAVNSFHINSIFYFIFCVFASHYIIYILT